MHANALFGLCIYSLLALSSSSERVYGALPAAKEQTSKGDHRGNVVTATEADFFHFFARPDIRALKWHISLYDEEALAPGYWFVAPYELLGQKERGASWVGPYIYDGKGELVWSGVPLFDGFNIFDFRPIEIAGRNMLTAIYKRVDAGVMMDSSYQIRKTVRWPGGYDAANMHDFTVFEEGTKAAVLTLEHYELSKERSRELGYDGRCNISTNGLLELDISTSPPTTLFNFSFIDHMSLDEITHPAKPDAARVEKECHKGWDSNHCNAIDRFANGDYLVSCRYTDALYKISREHNSIIWRLGGTRSDFKFAGDAKFSRQHHARVLEQNETHTVISLFDNARSESVETATHEYTRGLVLSLHNNVAEVVAEYPRPDREYTTSRGSLEMLPNGNAFICWTFHSRISEHAPDGELLMEAKLPPKVNTYRSYKSPWIGRPIDPPDVWSHVVENGSSDQLKTEVYASWNGATEVKTWNFYVSNPQGDKIKLATSVPRKGFETSTKLDGWVRYVIAEAIDSEGKSLGQSKVVESIPPDRNTESFVEEQDWLEKHVSSTQNNEGPETQGDSYPVDSNPLHEIASRLRRIAILPYLAGFCMCLLALVLLRTSLCLRSRIRRRRRVQEYTLVDKDDPEDDFELDESADQGDTGTQGKTKNERDDPDAGGHKR